MPDSSLGLNSAVFTKYVEATRDELAFKIDSNSSYVWYYHFLPDGE
jgi:hypothetical protein